MAATTEQIEQGEALLELARTVRRDFRDEPIPSSLRDILQEVLCPNTATQRIEFVAILWGADADPMMH